MIAGGFTCQRYGFNVGADKFSLLTIENGKNKHYAPIGMDIDFPKPKISLRQAARALSKMNVSILSHKGIRVDNVLMFGAFSGNLFMITKRITNSK